MQFILAETFKAIDELIRLLNVTFTSAYLRLGLPSPQLTSRYGHRWPSVSPRKTTHTHTSICTKQISLFMWSALSAHQTQLHLAKRNVV